MTASASPATVPFAIAAKAALAAPSGQPASAPLTRVALAYIEPRFKLYLRFGEPVRTHQLDRWRRCAVFQPGAMFCRIRWQANDYGTIRWQLMVMQAATPLDDVQRIPGVRPGARLLLHAEGEDAAQCRQWKQRSCQRSSGQPGGVSLGGVFGQRQARSEPVGERAPVRGRDSGGCDAQRLDGVDALQQRHVVVAAGEE